MNDEDRNIDWDNMSRAPGNAPDAGDGNIPSGTAERERQKRFDKLVLWLLATVLSFLLFSFTSLGPETWVGKSPMIHVLGERIGVCWSSPGRRSNCNIVGFHRKPRCAEMGC